MYLSRVKIDRDNRRKLKDLTHVGAVHNWVEQSFPDEVAAAIRTRKLWRIDQLGGDDYLLVVSSSAPDLRLFERYGVSGSGQTVSYDNFLQSIYEGLRAQFRVTLNPVIAVRQDEEGQRGRVMPHVTYEQQMQFLRDRSEKNGFQLKEGEYTIIERGYVPFKKSGQRDIRLSKATYQGVLTVTDKSSFQKTLTQGFGKKKAYGFGMMTIIPLG